jgi:hypothetical protein
MSAHSQRGCGLPQFPTDAPSPARWRIARDEFCPCNQLRCGNVQYLGDLEQHGDIRTLNTTFDQTNERSVQASGLRELLLREASVFSALAQDPAKSPLRAVGRLKLRLFLNLLWACQVNIVGYMIVLKSQI